MKKIILIATLISSFFAQSQEKASVEKSVYSVQTGLLGIWANGEFKLNQKWALRTEFGLDYGFWGGDLYDGTGHVFAPVVRIEPRYYYNLEKRGEKGKDVSINSANYISLNTMYRPDWFVISNKDNVSAVPTISFIPTWGIRRNLGKNFNYEAGFGLGYQYVFYKSAGFTENEGDVVPDLHLRIGYTF